MSTKTQSNECKRQRMTQELADETEAHERQTLEAQVQRVWTQNEFCYFYYSYYLFISISLLEKKNVIQFWDFMVNEFKFLRPQNYSNIFFLFQNWFEFGIWSCLLYIALWFPFSRLQECYSQYVCYNIYIYIYWETNTHTREREMRSNTKARHNSTQAMIIFLFDN